MYNVLNYGFPVYLICFELIFRSISSIDASSFIGPALASSGLSLFIGILKPKEVNLNVGTGHGQVNLPTGVKAYYQKDQKLIITSFVFLLVGIMFWYWTCIISLNNASLSVGVFPVHLLMGLGIYVVGIVLATIKESV